MTTRLLKLICLLLTLALTAGAPPARAQGTVALSALKIELWPEFDQPSTLVIFNGTLAPEVSLPAAVTLHIPAASGRPFAVAVQDPNGKLLNAQFTTAPSGESIAVTVQATFATFQVEYYDPTLKIEGEARDYAFRWIADFPIRAVTVRVQEPVGARGLRVEPAATPEGPGDLGLNY